MYWNKFALFFMCLICAPVPRPRAAAMADTPPVIQGPGQCTFCHAKLTEKPLQSPTSQWTSDSHKKHGMGCADCHGGNPKAAEAAGAHNVGQGFVGKPESYDIPDLCARCHGNPEFMVTENPALPVDQNEKYWTSRHGQLLKTKVGKVAQCVSCHTAHEVRPANDPLSSVYPVNVPATCAHCHSNAEYMEGFDIQTDQYEKYAASVHGRILLEKDDLGAPACNDCHGNHGAVPPGTQSLAHVCGNCHTRNAELFDGSPHAEVFESLDLAQCTVCHGHHAIARASADDFGMGVDSVCLDCHNEDDPGWRMGKKMYATFSELDAIQAKAVEDLAKAQDLGMDVSDGQFMLEDFRRDRLQLRTSTHDLNMDHFSVLAGETHEKGQGAIQVADDAVHEFQFRRKGLLISLLLSIPVVIFLSLIIRRLDRKKQ